MNKKDLSFGGTFCVLPWIEKYKDLKGREFFCCWSNQVINSKQEADQLREKIWRSEPISHCNSCYNLERNKTISPRQKETIRWFKDKEVVDYFTTDKCPPDKPLFLDLRKNNTCNLACISCNSNWSSLWAREMGTPIKLQNQIIDFNIINKYKKIYLAGGEPLIIQEYLDLIDYIAKNDLNIEVIINTNLTSLPQQFLESACKIKKLSLTVSVDSFEKVNEYHRYPLKWAKFVRNLDEIYNSKIPINFNTVVDAISILGIGGLNELSDIPDSWNLSILTEPTWLEIKNVPEKLKPLALENIKFLQQNKFYNKDISFKSKVNQLHHELEQPGNSNLLVENILQIDARRNINHSDYLGFSLI